MDCSEPTIVCVLILLLISGLLFDFSEMSFFLPFKKAYSIANLLLLENQLL